MKLMIIYCPIPKTKTKKINREISKARDLSPPADVTMLIIDVSTIIAMIIKIIIMKIPVLPSL
jgi:hypothetical protein